MRSRILWGDELAALPARAVRHCSTAQLFAEPADTMGYEWHLARRQCSCSSRPHTRPCPNWGPTQLIRATDQR
jgi:hypothetical protein